MNTEGTNVKMTGAVLRELCISMRQLEHIVERRPDLAPPVVAGRRLWTELHVDAMRAALEKRRLVRASREQTPAAVESTVHEGIGGEPRP